MFNEDEKNQTSGEEDVRNLNPSPPTPLPEVSEMRKYSDHTEPEDSDISQSDTEESSPKDE